MFLLRTGEFWVQAVAVLTVAGSLAVKLIGYPHQVRKIWKDGHIENISLLQYVLIFFTYLLWTVHGLLQRDMVIIISQSIGVLSSGLLLGTLLLLRRRHRQKRR